MRDLHAVLGVATVAVNAAAAAWGGWCWRRDEDSRLFWALLRAGQALVVLVAGQGAADWLGGEDLPDLHLVYGLTPIGVAFVAEQLRLVSAQTVLDQRGLESARAVGALPESDQRAIVRQIVRRELGIMALSALVIAFLGLRAGGWL